MKRKPVMKSTTIVGGKTLTIFAGVLFCLAGNVGAAVFTWGAAGAGGTGTWNTTNTNWWTGTASSAWVATNTADFSGTAGTVTLGSAITAEALSFGVDGYTLTGANTLTLNAGGITASGNTTVGTAIALGAAQTWTVAGGKMLTASGVISGNSLLTKSGSGTLVLSGTNTYSGGTTITGGTVKIDNASALGKSGTGGGALTFSGAGGTVQLGATIAANRDYVLTSACTIDTNGFDFSNAGKMSGAGDLTKIGTGTMTLKVNAQAHLLTGKTFILGGTLALASADILSQNDLTVDGPTSALSMVSYSDAVGLLTLKNGGAVTSTTATMTATGYAVESGSISAILAGTGVAMTKSTTGTVTLTGVNTYTGGTTITGGVLNVNNANALGAATGALTFNGAGATLQLGATIASGTRNVTLTQTGTYDTNGFSLASSGIFSGAGGLTKIGTGTLTLSSSNTYTGTTTISAGTLALTSSGSFTASPTLVVGSAGSSGAVLDLTAKASFNVLSGQTLKGIGTVNIGSGKTVTVDSGAIWAPGNSIGANAVTGNLTLSGTSNFELGTTGTSRASPGVSDRTDVSGNLVLGGTLNLLDNANANGQGSVGPGTYKIFTYGGTLSGSFSSIPNLTGYHFAVFNGGAGTGSGQGVFLDNYQIASANTLTDVALGNYRVASPGTALRTLTNGADATFGEGLRVSGSTTGSATVSGVPGTLIAGGSSAGLAIGATGGAGSKSGTVVLTLNSDGTGTSGYGTTALTGQTINVTGAAYDYASPNYTNTLAFGNVRVGASLTRAVTNTVITSASYQDSLDVSATNGGNTKLTVGNPGNITAGNSGNVTYTANAAGSLAATSSLGFTSNANGVSGLSNNSLTSGSVSVTGAAYDYASPSYTNTLAFGNVRVGASLTRAVTNTVITSASYQDSLDVSATNGGNTRLTVGNPGNITAGNSGNVTYTANAAGSLAATSSLGFTSNANGLSGLSNSALTSGSVSVTGAAYDYAQAKFSSATLAFGYIHQGKAGVSVQTVAFGNQTVTNAAYQDLLDVSATTGNLLVTATGFSGLAASTSGSTTNNLTFAVSTGTVGSLASTASLILTSNANGISSLSNGTAAVVGGGTIATSGYVYSGAGVWNTNGNGNWSDFGKWTANGGAPGLDTSFAENDTATFDNTVLVAGSNATVTLNGASASLKGIIFNTPTGSGYTIARAAAEVLTLNNGSSTATIDAAGGRHLISAPVTLMSNLAATVTNSGDMLTISGIISGSGKRLEKLGAGMLVLSGINTYDGGTTVTAGTLVADNAAAFGDGAITVNGGTLDLNGQNVTNAINYQSGVLANMSTAMTTYVLDGATLNTNGLNLGGTTVVDARGMLTGVGMVGALTVSNGGTLSPGNSPGYLTVTSLDLAAGSNTIFEIWGRAAAVSGVNYDLEPGGGQGYYDVIGITGGGSNRLAGLLTVTFDGGTGYAPARGDSFRLVDLQAGSTLADAGYSWCLPTLSGSLYWDTSSFLSTGSISIAEVPEPATVGLLVFGLLALLGRRRR